MKFPMINKRPHREVNIPQLSGGLNLRDSLSGVRDNQMTDCINMWYRNGALRTRVPFITNEKMMENSLLSYENVCIADIQSHPQVKNSDAVLVSFVNCDGDFKTGFWLANLLFFWQYEDKTVYAGSIEFDGLREIICKTKADVETQVRKSTRLIFEKDGYIYLFLNENGGSFSTYKSKITDKLCWEYINQDEYYIPTVYTHCKRTGWDEFGGVQFEAYNLIGNKYKMIYSAYNEADSDKYHPMRYVLGQELADSGCISVDITSYNSEKDEAVTVTHSIEYTIEQGEAIKNGEILYETQSTDGLYLFVKYNYVGFLSEIEAPHMVATLDTDEKIKKYACSEDNIVITAPYKTGESELKKVFYMTRNIWFGGSANGINDGSRLFLCGNCDEKEKSLVVWSSLNNPLYFPENNYAYVGDKSQGVTAFGQQGENLIIFKEKATYYSFYNANDSITAEDLINQLSIDYEANSVYFPMVQLNSSIGCDCPNTVQLCRNRLVWTNSDGSVYTLYSNNQYSERTIYKISEMISSELSKENDLKNAVSCDFEGHYLLGVGSRIYVMDYNSYGYQYASSFSKNEDSNAQIPWYIWTYDCGDDAKLYEINNRLMLATCFKTDEGATVVFSTLSLGENDACDKVATYDTDSKKMVLINKNIVSMLQTKMFDFSALGYSKNIEKVSVAFGSDSGQTLNVSFISNVGCDMETIEVVGSDVEERDAAYLVVKNFYPTMRAVGMFGVKIEGEGQLTVNGLSIQYRLLGGVK